MASSIISQCHSFKDNHNPASLLHLDPYYVHNNTQILRSHPSSTSISLGMLDKKPHCSDTPFAPPNISPCFEYLDELCEIRALNSARELHAQMLKMPRNKGSSSLATIDETLMRYYLEFDDFVSATKVFFVGFSRNYLLWNSFLEKFDSFGGDPYEILAVFRELHKKGVEFDSIAFTVVLKICLVLMDLKVGLQIHASLVKRGFHFDVHLCCALINLYEKFWGIDRAYQVFDEAPHKEDFLWNTIIMANMRSERWFDGLELFRDMQLSSAKATGGTIVKVLQACGKLRALNEGKQIHGYVLRRGLVSNMSISNSIISMYSKNHSLKMARTFFDSMEVHNLSSLNSIISCYASHGNLEEALNMFQEMEASGIKPDIITWNSLMSGLLLQGSYKAVLADLRSLQVAGLKPDSGSVTSALQAIIELGIFNLGKEIHGYILRNKLDHDVYVCPSLMDMYIKNDELHKAQKVFDLTKNKNICAWNSLISGYSFKGQFSDAEELLNQMEKEGIEPDMVTWNSLISGYSMHGRSNEAMDAINRMKSSGFTPNVVSWTAMVSGSARNENYTDSIRFFGQMQAQNVRPNSTTICSLLRACTGRSLLKKGEEIHCLCIRHGFLEDMHIATALIGMYGKAGKLKAACKIFGRIEGKTLPCWNCMMMGYAIHGHVEEVISLFNKMLKTGIIPDSITFTALLSGCKNSSRIEDGWKYFDSMSADYNIVPTIEHYSCMVDLLGKSGFLDEALHFIKTMPVKQDASIWGALLASCRIHKNIKLAKTASRKLFKLEPYNSANYVMMMNLYSALGKWDDVQRLRDTMIAAGLRSPAVWSWIQVNQTIHMFSTEGKPHPEEGEIYFELYQLVSKVKKLGYVPDISCVYQNIDNNEKEKILLSHTEKLAITYGLMKTKGGSSPIRVVKNTRVCQDCHTLSKYISWAENREILIGDGGRFHHFVNGKCSCNGCW